MKNKFVEIFKDIETLKKFCKINKITPFGVILIWEEKPDED